MPMMFSRIEDAAVWLTANGWRKNVAGDWIKDKRKATINPWWPAPAGQPSQEY